jgi:hypothetical protein
MNHSPRTFLRFIEGKTEKEREKERQKKLHKRQKEPKENRKIES